MPISSESSPVAATGGRAAVTKRQRTVDILSAELSAEADAAILGLPDFDDDDEADESPEGPPRPDQIAADLLVARTLSGLPDAKQLIAGPTVIVVEVPHPSFVGPIRGALCQLLSGSGRVQDGDRINTNWDSRRTAPWRLVLFGRDGSSKSDTAKTGNEALVLALGVGAPVIGIAPNPERHLPSDLTRAADHRLMVPRLNPTVVEQVIARVTGQRPPRRLAEDLCRSLDLLDLGLAVRRGTTAEACLARLERIAAAKASGAASAGPTLADLHGYGEAKAWGEALARDLGAYCTGRLPWSHLDRGALLVGPPGVGKTFYARALARTCAVPLVTGSLSEWQAAGHLGDLLRAMRAAFDAARQQAPCILFLDEVDSFGDRAAFDDHHRDYSTQVVNGFLEELDGVQGREGVVVLAASNNAERIDPAIRRSGRLDRTIRLALPDAGALVGILRHHLGGDLADADLMPAALAGCGGSGADAARWVRTARQAARHAGRAVALDDLMAAIRGGDAAPTRPDERRRIAVHEAGHAVAICLGGIDAVDRVSIVGRGSMAGITSLRPGGDATQQGFRQRLIALLAGRAAEQVFLGEPSAGAGGGPESDLAMATLLATAMEASLGFSDAGLVWRAPLENRALAALLAQDPRLARRVSARLEAAYREAVDLIGRHRPLVARVVERLLADGYLEGADLAALVRHQSRGGTLVPDEAKA